MKYCHSASERGCQTVFWPASPTFNQGISLSVSNQSTPRGDTQRGPNEQHKPRCNSCDRTSYVSLALMFGASTLTWQMTTQALQAAQDQKPVLATQCKAAQLNPSKTHHRIPFILALQPAPSVRLYIFLLCLLLLPLIAVLQALCG